MTTSVSLCPGLEQKLRPISESPGESLWNIPDELDVSRKIPSDRIVYETNGLVLKEVPTQVKSLEPYLPLIDEETLRDLERLSLRLHGLRIGHLNATSEGGGVAELLKSLNPLANGLGIESKWYCLGPSPAFFQVTKNIHNSLQGGEWRFDVRAHQIFMNHMRRIAKEMETLDLDLAIIHDPQLCLLIETLPWFHRAIWHCHIDTSTPNQSVWDYFYPYLQHYDRVVFCLPDYVNGSLPRNRVTFIQPAIDPLNSKNRPLSISNAKEILSRLGIDTDRPLITQVSRFDPWKDPQGVIEAYRIAKREIPTLQLALVGVLAAQDDPEALVVFHQVEQYRGGDPDIHLFADPFQVGDREVNAFQTASEIVLQKSLREGFGLTVAEAMWKSTPVIGGNCGGIRVQIKDGTNGYLVNTVTECAERIIALLNDPSARSRMGNKARESVGKHFLMPRFLRDYLQLAEELILGV